MERQRESDERANERTNERNQKNAGISGEINVMRQFDSSRSGGKGGREGWKPWEEVRTENTIVLRSRSPSRSYWFLRDAYFRNSSESVDERPSVSLKLEWIFDDRLLVLITA